MHLTHPTRIWRLRWGNSARVFTRLLGLSCGVTGQLADATGDFACLSFVFFWPLNDVFLRVYLSIYYASDSVSCIMSTQPNYGIKTTSSTAGGIRVTAVRQCYLVWRCLRYRTFNRFSRTPTCDRRTNKQTDTQQQLIPALASVARVKMGNIFHRVTVTFVIGQSSRSQDEKCTKRAE